MKVTTGEKTKKEKEKEKESNNKSNNNDNKEKGKGGGGEIMYQMNKKKEEEEEDGRGITNYVVVDDYDDDAKERTVSSFSTICSFFGGTTDSMSEPMNRFFLVTTTPTKTTTKATKQMKKTEQIDGPRRCRRLFHYYYHHHHHRCRFVSLYQTFLMVLFSFIIFPTFLLIDYGANGAFTTFEDVRFVPVPFGVVDNFKPLSCNDNLIDDNANIVDDICTNWSDMGYNLDYGVSILCGTCVYMDITDDSVLDIKGGLDIQGKLIFSPQSKVVIRTPAILVQGILILQTSEQMISPENRAVEFVLTGSLDLNFQPHEENEHCCDSSNSLNSTNTVPGKCEIGKKAFVIAGGKVIIDGWAAPSSYDNNGNGGGGGEYNGMDLVGEGSECSTWSMLLDVTSPPSPVPILEGYDEYTEWPAAPNSNCTISNPGDVGDRILFYEDFENVVDISETEEENEYIIPNGWYAEGGSQIELSSLGGVSQGIYLKSTQRTKEFQGPYFVFPESTISCLVPNKPYIFTITLRLVSTYYEDAGRNSWCYMWGTHCPQVIFQSMKSDETLLYKTLIEMEGSLGKRIPDGEWITLQSTVIFDDEDFDVDGPYNILTVNGPELGIEIDIASITLKLPSRNHYPIPESMCTTNLVVNGDAELDEHSIFPHNTTNINGSYVSVHTEEEDQGAPPNRYFKIIGRTQDFGSLKISLPIDCIEEYSMYEFSSKIRFQPPSIIAPEDDKIVKSRMSLLIHGKNVTEDDPPYVVETVAWCDSYDEDDDNDILNTTTTTTTTSSSTEERSWIKCKANFMFEERHSNAKKLELVWVIENNNSTDVDYDDIIITRIHGPVDGLILPKNTTSCWGVGSEIMITSPTMNFTDTVTNVIKNVTIDPTEPEGDKSIVYLDKNMRKHTTIVDSPYFACEVALLTRNIIFSADNNEDYVVVNNTTNTNTNHLHGGHFMVFHTPNVPQIIEGVEIRGFGQMGNAARYPLHFHMCQDVYGTRIIRNSVRDSFQRCYVIHDTHNTTLFENVAHNTFGHCYMIEDGSERDNILYRNIGAVTKNTPHEGIIASTESDFRPGTFWSASVTNYFIENVAGGCEDSGFWFELLEHVRGPAETLNDFSNYNPSIQQVFKFVNNKFHSNKRDGLTLYPNGNFPEYGESVFVNTISYLNGLCGILLHNSRSLVVNGGVLADNRFGIEIDKQADAVKVENVIIAGQTQSFLKNYVEPVAGTYSHCPAFRPVIGIQLHSFLRYRDSLGYVLNNVTFLMEGFNEETNGGCSNSSAMDVDPEHRGGHYDAYATLKNLHFIKHFDDENNDENPNSSSSIGQVMPGRKMNLCEIHHAGIVKDIAMEDVTGDLNPMNEEEEEGSGFFVSNSAQMTTLCNTVYTMDDACAAYCPNTCMRAINFAFSSTEVWQDVVMRATKISSSTESNNGTTTQEEQGEYVDFISYFDNHTDIREDGTCCEERRYENTIYQRRRYVTPILPYGTYELRFIQIDKLYGMEQTIWPQFVEKQWEKPPLGNCTPYITDEDITLIIPPPEVNFCNDLIQNGNLNQGDNYWMHVGGGISITQPGYVREEDEEGGGGFALTSIDRWGEWQGPAQFLDTRCLIENGEYEVMAKVRLFENITQEFVSCNPNIKEMNGYYACPRISLRFRKLLGKNEIGDEVDTTYYYPLAETVHSSSSSSSSKDWYTVHGVFTVPYAMSDADTALLFFEKARIGVNMIVDDISVKPFLRSCTQLIYNSNCGDGDVDNKYSDSRFWYNFGDTMIDIINEPNDDGSPNNALITKSRNLYWSSMAQDIKNDCFIIGDSYTFSSRIKLVSSTDPTVYMSCNRDAPWTESCRDGNPCDSCPRMRLQASNGNVTSWFDVGYIINEYQSNQWNLMVGSLIITEEIVQAEKLTLFWSHFQSPGMDIIVDDVTIMPWNEWDCSINSVKNGNPDDNDKNDVRYWNSWIGGSIEIYNDNTNNNIAFKSSHRPSVDSGFAQVFEKSCLPTHDNINQFYHVSAKVKLMQPDLITPFHCDPSSTLHNIVCPWIILGASNSGGSPFYRPIGSVQGPWKSGNDEWNEIKGIFTFFSYELMATNIYLIVNRAPPGITMIVDDIVITPL